MSDVEHGPKLELWNSLTGVLYFFKSLFLLLTKEHPINEYVIH